MTGYFFRVKKVQFTQIGLMAVTGAICGFLIVQFLGLSKWWAIFTLLGMIIPCVAVFSGNIKRFLLLSLVLVLPVNADVNIPTPLGSLPISLVSIIIMLLCTIWVVELVIDKNQKVHFFPKTTIPALAFIGISMLSIIVNMHDVFTSLSGMIVMVFYFLLYFYLANNVRTERDVKYIIHVFLLGALFQSGLAIFELASGANMSLTFQVETTAIAQIAVGDTEYPRISGTLGHPNALAVFLSSTIILMISLIFCEVRRIWKFVYWIGIGIGLFVIVNTFSRSAWFVLAVFSLLTFLLYSWKSKNIKRAIFPMLVFVFIIMVGTLAFWTKIADRSVVDDSVAVRMPLMEVAINVIKDNPFFGVGQGNYLAKMYVYDDTSLGVTTFFPSFVHNMYLLIAAETGIIGLLIILWFNYAVWSEGWQFVKSDISFLTNVGLSLVSLLVMLFAFTMVNPGQLIVIYIYYGSGMLIAIKKIVKDAELIPSESYY